MKNFLLSIGIVLSTMLTFSCSSDDDTTVQPPIKPPVVDVQVPVSEYKTAILKDWYMVKKQFLKGDKSLLKEIDYKKEQKECSLEKWNFKEEQLTMFTYKKNNCLEIETKMKYAINEKNFYFFYPDFQGHFNMNHFLFVSFTQTQFVIIEKEEYTDQDVINYNYPTGTRFVQFVLERK